MDARFKMRGLLEVPATARCDFTYDRWRDESALLQALRDGTFKTGEPLSDTEISDLRHSKKWKQR
jgi:hypothetical protein